MQCAKSKNICGQALFQVASRSVKQIFLKKAISRNKALNI